MKYILLVACVVAYISGGSAVELQNRKAICACEDLLKKILNKVSQAKTALVNVNQELDDIQVRAHNVDIRINKQGNELKHIDQDLAAIIVIQQSTTVELTQQSAVLDCIIADIAILLQQIEDINQDVNEQTCVIGAIQQTVCDIAACTEGGTCRIQ